jgi:ABC-type microcin C transport system duplicated ATPase subunit YejF
VKRMLDIRNLTIRFTDRHCKEPVVRNLSIHMDYGDRLGLVGESGSGKTQTALAVAGLLPRSRTEAQGQILFEGQDLTACTREELRRVQGRGIGMIFQEPMTSLNPLMRIGAQVEETLRIHTDLSPSERKSRAIEALRLVELPEPEATYRKYPHQLSGGQRQRVMIAAAFVCEPKLLICDEPTTALDVTVQAQILKLLRKINEEKGVGILFISHDLKVVRKLCDKVAVMHRGEIVEYGDVEEIFTTPRDAYTQRLVAAIPQRKRRN